MSSRFSSVHYSVGFVWLTPPVLQRALSDSPSTLGCRRFAVDHSVALKYATNRCKMLDARLSEAFVLTCAPFKSYLLDNGLILQKLHAAVDAAQFLPLPDGAWPAPGGRVTVVALSRLVYRKGVDLLAVVIPAVCCRHPHVDFVIGAVVSRNGRLLMWQCSLEHWWWHPVGCRHPQSVTSPSHCDLCVEFPHF